MVLWTCPVCTCVFPCDTRDVQMNTCMCTYIYVCICMCIFSPTVLMTPPPHTPRWMGAVGMVEGVTSPQHTSLTKMLLTFTHSGSMYATLTAPHTPLTKHSRHGVIGISTYLLARSIGAWGGCFLTTWWRGRRSMMCDRCVWVWVGAPSPYCLCTTCIETSYQHENLVPPYLVPPYLVPP